MIWISVIATVAAVFAIIIAPSIAPSWWGLSAPTSASQWGEYLGGPLAAVAMGWFVTAVFLQKRELVLQRKELELQREELARLGDGAEASNKLHETSNLISTLDIRRKELDATAELITTCFPGQFDVEGSKIKLSRTIDPVNDAASFVAIGIRHGSAMDLLQTNEQTSNYAVHSGAYKVRYLSLVSDCAISGVPDGLNTQHHRLANVLSAPGPWQPEEVQHAVNPHELEANADTVQPLKE